MKALRIAGATLILAAAVIGASPQSASAHAASAFFKWKWEFNSSGTQIDWAFDSDMPNNNMRDRFLDADDTWNALAGNRQLNKVSNYNGFLATSCAIYERNGVHWGEPDGGGEDYLAVTYGCSASADELWSANIQMDSDENWSNCTGCSGTIGNNEFDSQGTATHEFGHMLGYNHPDNKGHFHGEDNCQVSNYSQTMCPTTAPGLESYTRRTLEDHDKHTFNNAY